MSVEKRPLVLPRLQRYFVRPITVLLCVLVVVLAVAQIIARTALYFASEFTPQLNTLLASKRIRVQGVSAQWNGLNPSVSVEQITFGPGQMQGFVLELDTLESLIRNAWIPRHVFWRQAQLHFDQTPQGWRLRNQQALVLPFDVVKSLEHADYLFGNARFTFHPQSGESITLDGGISARNLQSEHFMDVHLAEPGSATSRLNASLVEQVSWFDQQVLFRDLRLQGQLKIPAGLLGNVPMVIDGKNVRWRQQSDRGQGRLHIVAHMLAQQIDTQLAPLRFALDLDLVGSEGRINGVSRVVNIRSGDANRSRSLELAPLHVQLLGDAAGSELAVWNSGVDIAAISEVLLPSAGMWPIFGEWLQALAPSGQIHSVHGFIDAQGFSGYSASVSGLRAQGYRGSPSLDNAQGRVWGGGRNLALQLNADDTTLQFPDIFATPWPFEHIQGLVKFHIQPGSLALRGQNIKGRRHDTAIAAQFAVIRPKERYNQRLTLAVSMDQASFENVPDYVSRKMAPELQRWLRAAPEEGQFSDLLGAYHGQVQLRNKELGRRLELLGKVRQGRVRYEPRWPVAEDLIAEIHLAGSTTSIQVASAEMAGARINAGRIEIGAGGQLVNLRFDAVSDASDLLAFIRSTPLQASLPFVRDNWAASGELRVQGQMAVPIGEQTDQELALALDFAPQQVSLSLPDYRFEIADLRGQGSFTLPHQLQGDFVGQLFNNAAAVVVTNTQQNIGFAVAGVFAPRDVYALMDSDDFGVLQGASQFGANLTLDMGSGVSSLQVTTDLQGMAVALPGEIGKAADVTAPSRFDLQFLEDFQSLRWRYQNTQGWLHLDGKIVRGSIGLGVTPLTIAADQQSVTVAGELAEVSINDWVAFATGADGAAVDWQMNDLRVGELIIDELVFADLLVSGRQRPQELVFSARSENLIGRVDLSDDKRLGIDLQFLRLPELAQAPADSAGLSPLLSDDPLSPELGRSLPAAWVAIEKLSVGDEDFGNWQFEIEPMPDLVRFVGLDADFKGVHLRDAEFTWDLSGNQSVFAGRVDLDNLVQTLPLWDYAPTLETASANLQVDLVWPGSPPNIQLLALQGSMAFKAKDGRFLDAETSANGLRFISLFTPSALAKRINKFDFSDIVDEGMSFDRLSAAVNVGQEELVFAERMVLESPSSSFEFGGRINLRTEALDNEMIVTLPVSNSLPWYAAYLALANPVAGLGVMLGEQILRKPIQQFSSAKFSIGGTLDDPKVKFVSLWDKSMKAVPQPGSVAPIVLEQNAGSATLEEKQNPDTNLVSEGTLAAEPEPSEVTATAVGVVTQDAATEASEGG